MIKLLHIGLDVKPTPIWISKALKEVTNYAEILPGSGNDKILNLFESHKPDLVFMQVQRGGVIGLDLIQHMSQKSLIINWSGDCRDPIPQWYFDFNPYCVTCFSNEKHAQEIGGEYLQIGIDPEIFFKRKSQVGADIVFMANQYNKFPLSEYRNQAVEFLRSNYKYNFKLFGSGWKTDGSFMGDQTAESNYYAGSKIGISISQFDIDRYFSDRLIRIMGSGCFALSHHYAGIEKDFKVGTHLDSFCNLEELKNKIDFYLNNDNERQRIASNGYKHVHRNFTTKNMVNDILRIYEKYADTKKTDEKHEAESVL